MQLWNFDPSQDCQVASSVMAVNASRMAPAVVLFHGRGARVAFGVDIWSLSSQASVPLHAWQWWRCKLCHPCLAHSIRAKAACVLICRTALNTLLGHRPAGSYFVKALQPLAGFSEFQQTASFAVTQWRKYLPLGLIFAESLQITCFLVPEGRCLPKIELSVLISPLPSPPPVTLADLNIKSGSAFLVSKQQGLLKLLCKSLLLITRIIMIILNSTRQNLPLQNAFRNSTFGLLVYRGNTEID